MVAGSDPARATTGRTTMTTPRPLGPLLRTLLAGAVVLPLLAACGARLGPTATESREVDDVVAVELATSGHLTVTRGEEPSLTITAAERVLDELTAEVVDGVLVLGRDRPSGWAAGPVEYELVLPALEAVSVRGSGDVDVDELGGSPAITVEGSGDVDVAAASGESLAVAVTGSGEVRVGGVAVEDVRLDLEGSGDVVLAGRTVDQHVTVRGSGTYDGVGLSSDEAVVALEGSGGADVDVSDRLTAVVAGSGSVTHAGGAVVDGDVDGSGEISER